MGDEVAYVVDLFFSEAFVYADAFEASNRE